MKDIDGQEIQVGDVVLILNNIVWGDGTVCKVTRILPEFNSIWVVHPNISGMMEGAFNPEDIFCLFYRKPISQKYPQIVGRMQRIKTLGNEPQP